MIIELPAGKAMAVQEQSKLSRRTMVISKVVDKDEIGDIATMDQVINAQKDAETLGSQLREMRRHHTAYQETMATQKQQITNSKLTSSNIKILFKVMLNKLNKSTIVLPSY